MTTNTNTMRKEERFNFRSRHKSKLLQQAMKTFNINQKMLYIKSLTIIFIIQFVNITIQHEIISTSSMNKEVPFKTSFVSSLNDYSLRRNGNTLNPISMPLANIETQQHNINHHQSESMMLNGPGFVTSIDDEPIFSIRGRDFATAPGQSSSYNNQHFLLQQLQKYQRALTASSENNDAAHQSNQVSSADQAPSNDLHQPTNGNNNNENSLVDSSPSASNINENRVNDNQSNINVGDLIASQSNSETSSISKPANVTTTTTSNEQQDELNNSSTTTTTTSTTPTTTTTSATTDSPTTVINNNNNNSTTDSKITVINVNETTTTTPTIKISNQSDNSSTTSAPQQEENNKSITIEYNPTTASFELDNNKTNTTTILQPEVSSSMTPQLTTTTTTPSSASTISRQQNDEYDRNVKSSTTTTTEAAVTTMRPKDRTTTTIVDEDEQTTKLMESSFSSNRSSNGRSTNSIMACNSKDCNSYVVATVPLLEKWNSNNNSNRVVNEFIFLPEDSSSSLTFEPETTSYSTTKRPLDNKDYVTIKAEHRTIDDDITSGNNRASGGETTLTGAGDDIELDYITSEAESAFSKASTKATSLKDEEDQSLTKNTTPPMTSSGHKEQQQQSFLEPFSSINNLLMSLQQQATTARNQNPIITTTTTFPPPTTSIATTAAAAKINLVRLHTNSTANNNINYDNNISRTLKSNNQQVAVETTSNKPTSASFASTHISVSGTTSTTNNSADINNQTTTTQKPVTKISQSTSFTVRVSSNTNGNNQTNLRGKAATNSGNLVMSSTSPTMGTTTSTSTTSTTTTTTTTTTTRRPEQQQALVSHSNSHSQSHLNSNHRLNQKLLRIDQIQTRQQASSYQAPVQSTSTTQKPASTTSTTTTTTTITPTSTNKSVSNDLARKHNNSSTRRMPKSWSGKALTSGNDGDNKHRKFFNEPVGDQRRRTTILSQAPPRNTNNVYSPIINGADEEEAKILTRYSIPSQLSRLSAKQTVDLNKNNKTTTTSTSTSSGSIRNQMNNDQRSRRNPNRVNQRASEEDDKKAKQLADTLALEDSIRHLRESVITQTNRDLNRDKKDVVTTTTTSPPYSNAQNNSIVMQKQVPTVSTTLPPPPSTTTTTTTTTSTTVEPALVVVKTSEQSVPSTIYKQNETIKKESDQQPFEEFMTLIASSKISDVPNQQQQQQQPQSVIVVERKLPIVVGIEQQQQQNRNSLSFLSQPIIESNRNIKDNTSKRTQPMKAFVPEQRHTTNNNLRASSTVRPIFVTQRTSSAYNVYKSDDTSLLDEYEGSVEDQLAKDALHNRAQQAQQKSKPKSTTNTYTSNRVNNKKPTSIRTNDNALSSSLGSNNDEQLYNNGKWIPDVDENGNNQPITANNGEESSVNQSNLLPGRPGIDYPIHWQVPKTSFDCRNYEQSGFYADVESDCQAYHSCHKGRGGRHTFLCPNGTLFSQELLTCDWWYNVECSASKLYLNAGSPSAAETIGSDINSNNNNGSENVRLLTNTNEIARVS